MSKAKVNDYLGNEASQCVLDQPTKYTLPYHTTHNYVFRKLRFKSLAVYIGWIDR